MHYKEGSKHSSRLLSIAAWSVCVQPLFKISCSECTVAPTPSLPARPHLSLASERAVVRSKVTVPSSSKSWMGRSRSVKRMVSKSHWMRSSSYRASSSSWHHQWWCHRHNKWKTLARLRLASVWVASVHLRRVLSLLRISISNMRCWLLNLWIKKAVMSTQQCCKDWRGKCTLKTIG